MFKNHSVLYQCFHYLKVHKRFWLLPALLTFLLFALLIVVAETAPVVSPFIYTLF